MPKILAMNYSFMKLAPHHIEMLRGCIPDAVVETFTAPPTPEQLRDADYIFGNPTAQSLAHCERLRLLQLATAGLNGYDRETLPAGARIATATGGYGLAISEHMLSVLLCMMRRLPQYVRNQEQCLWKFEGNVRSIWGSTVLVLGLGDIGSEFARRVGMLGATVIGVRRAGKDKPDYIDELYDTAELDNLLPRADVVAMALPGTPATEGILNRARIGAMRPGAYLINVGRGSAVDQEALCDALDAGALGGAALDVCVPEPLPAEHRIWRTPNLLLTPHVAGGASLPETVNRIVDIAARNIAAVHGGGALISEADFDTGYRKL